MRSLRLVALFAATCLFTTAVNGDDKAGKAHGQLPQGWAKLGLSDEQKTKIYDIQNKAKAEIEKLEKQIADVKEKETKDRVAVLTADQKTKLRDIANSKLGDK